jgi:hypothetical protein
MLNEIFKARNTITDNKGCLSRFLLLFLPVLQIFVDVKPGHAHLHTIKILLHDNFLAPRQ